MYATYSFPHGPHLAFGSVAAWRACTGLLTDAGEVSKGEPGNMNPLHVWPPSSERLPPIHAQNANADSSSPSDSPVSDSRSDGRR